MTHLSVFGNPLLAPGTKAARIKSQRRNKKTKKPSRADKKRDREQKAARVWIDRARDVKALGFKSYKAYLASPLWASIRALVMTRDEGACGLCGRRQARYVHHLSYEIETLKGDTLDHLIAACGHCHKYVEFEDDGKKTCLKRSRKLTHILCRRVDKANRAEEKLDQGMNAGLDAAIAADR